LNFNRLQCAISYKTYLFRSTPISFTVGEYKMSQILFAGKCCFFVPEKFNTAHSDCDSSKWKQSCRSHENNSKKITLEIVQSLMTHWNSHRFAFVFIFNETVNKRAFWKKVLKISFWEECPPFCACFIQMEKSCLSAIQTFSTDFDQTCYRAYIKSYLNTERKLLLKSG
jgi:hypothetical protein